MTRPYPLDPPAEERASSRQSWLREDGLAIRAARLTASALLELLNWRRQHRDLAQSMSTVLLLLFGVSLAGSAGVIDEYLHRGVESGVEEPYIVQPAGKELATNTDLLPFSGPGLTEMVDVISGAGFKYVRQEFSWATIEPEKGDRSFARYEELAAQLERRKLVAIAVITDVPDWAMVQDPTSPDAHIIVDSQAFTAFTQELATFFVDTVGFIQMLDRPNLASATPRGAITPVDFTRLLGAGASGAYTGNSEIKVILPELAVHSDLPNVPTDLDYLRALYAAGAAPLFDIAAIALDGTTYSPDDRTVDPNRQNFSRAILYRELMQDSEDNQHPLWATSYGWAANESVSRETQAEFVTRGLERSWAEWPWMGLMVQWEFFTGNDSPDAPYAILETNGNPTPLWNKLITDRVRDEAAIAHTGFTPMETSAVNLQGNWQDQHLEGRTFKTTNQVNSSMTFTFSGTGVVAFMRSGPQVGRFEVAVDGKTLDGDDGTQWDFWWYDTNDEPLELVSGLEDTQHTITVTLVTEGGLTMGGLVVARDAPFTWPIMLMAAASFLSLFLAMRSFIYLVAIRAGHLLRHGSEQNPQLPLMPNWRPTRRA